MKTMTCKQLGGACDKEFTASTFDEIAELSKIHGTDMFHLGDEPHLQAMQKMSALAQSPKAMQEWFEGKKALFEAL